MNDFVARIQPLKVVLSILILLAFAAVGVWMTGILAQPFKPSTTGQIDLMMFSHPPPSRRYPDWLSAPVGWMCTIIFVWGGVFGVIRLTKPADHLRVNRMGLIVPSYTDKLIAWSDIADIATWSFRGHKHLLIKLHDPSRFQRKPLRRIMDRLNRHLSGGDIALSMSGTDRTLKQALEAIEAFGPEGLRPSQRR